jgi:hypothetical protein
MSDGSIGQGISYWATINIRGDLSKEQLQAVVKELKRIMQEKVTSDGDLGDDGDPIEGTVLQATRASDGKATPLTGSPMSIHLKTEKKP